MSTTQERSNAAGGPAQEQGQGQWLGGFVREARSR